MRIDLYTKALLTIIAVSLFALNLRGGLVAESARRSPVECTGLLKANEWGGVIGTIGGYAIQVTCQ